MVLAFINNADIDRQSRRLIRSVAARGRNVGKTHPSRGRRKQLRQTNNRPPFDRIHGFSGGCSDVVLYQATVPIQRPVGSMLAAFSFAAEVDSISRTLVSRVLSFLRGPFVPPELLGKIEDVGPPWPWTHYIFVDQAYYHCALALSLTGANSLVASQRDAVEAMRHLNQAFRLLNKKLSGSEALHDTTIVAVVALTQHERLRGRYRQGLVHFEGLQRIVTLRGGISKLVEHRPTLAQKVFMADLEFALHLGTATHFKVEDMSDVTVAWLASQREDLAPFDYACPLLERLDSALQGVFMDIMVLARTLNECFRCCQKLDTFRFHDVLILLGYRLIRLCQIASPRATSQPSDVTHLGLIAFTTTFILGLNRRVPDFHLLAESFRWTVRNSTDADVDSHELRLWAIFVGRVSVLTPEDDAWIIPKVSETSLALGFRTWEDLQLTFTKYPWVHDLHDAKGKELWQIFMPSLENSADPEHVISPLTISRALTMS